MLFSIAVVLLMQAPIGLSLVPSMICLTNPLDLVPDPEDCHIFYQCDLNPQPMTCGNMMFNSLRQVCDWPSTVLQLRPECRQEDQFRFSGQEYPYYRHRTLRMLNLIGDGDQFSQTRLRAPQDIGLGRRRNYGNREYFGQEVSNKVEDDVDYNSYEDDDDHHSYEDDVDYDSYEDEEEEVVTINEKAQNDVDYYNYEDEREQSEIYQDTARTTDYDSYEEEEAIDEREQTRIIQETARTIAEEYSNNVNFDIEDIKRRLPQIVQDSLSKLASQDNNKPPATKQSNHAQAVSTPADTIRLQPHRIRLQPHRMRLQPHRISISATPQISQPNPTTNIKLQHDSPVVAPPQGPTFEYQQAYPAPVPSPAPAFRKLQPVPMTSFIPPTVPVTSFIPPTPLILGTKHIPQHQNNGQAVLSNHNQPKLAPILVEETREYKPVWTVTRERPRQILIKYRQNRQNRDQADCADRDCPKQRQRVLRKIKKNVIAGEKHQLEKKENAHGRIRNMQTDLEEPIDVDEKKAITLKEAYDRAIIKVDQSKNYEPAPANLLHKILNRDFGSNKDIHREYDGYQTYVNSDDLRSEVLGEEEGSGLIEI